MSQSSVFAIAQDARGLMWFGTRDGLNRYDSRQIKTYFHDPADAGSISDNSIYSLLSDSKGRLWVGTSRGLNLYDPTRDRFMRVPSDHEDNLGLSEKIVTCLYEDRHKNLWVGTRTGLYLMKAGSENASALVRFVSSGKGENELINNDVRSITEDTQGNLWIGTSDGLSRLSIGNQNVLGFRSYRLPELTALSSKNNGINSVVEDSRYGFLVATENTGLLSFDAQTGVFKSLNWTGGKNAGPDAVRLILKDKRRDDYLIGTIGGLYIADPVAGKFVALKNDPEDVTSLTDNSIRSLYADRDGSVWVGTFHGGVNMYNPRSRQFGQVPQDGGLAFTVAGALAIDRDDNLWIGTEGTGLYFRNTRTGMTQHFQHVGDDPNSLSHNNVKTLLVDGDRGLWVGTIKGLNYFNFNTRKFTRFRHQPGKSNSLPDDAIYDIVQDDDHNIWIATYHGGVCRYNPGQNSFDTFSNDSTDQTSISSDGVTSLFIDSRENLWLGTTDGLNIKKEGSVAFKRLVHDPQDSTSISGNYILCVYEDSQHRIWIGTRGSGLNLLSDDGSKFYRLSSSHGLPGNTIYGMQEDGKGFLWISTENGLSRLDPSDFSVNNYNRSDGLACKQFNVNSYCKDSKGLLYFGGYNGIAVFDPENITRNTTVPEVRFIGLRLFDNEMKPGDDVLAADLNYTDGIVLRHDQNIFSVEFAVINYINPDKNKFAYMLAGFEDQWNSAREPSASYMNLAPGNYTLLVKGSNNDGVWNETPLTLPLRILPPPWKTWWAYTSYFLICLGLVYGWSRIYKKRMALEHDLKIEHLENLKQEEIHQAKLKFFNNIVHEIRTPLMLMVGPVESMLMQYPSDTFLRKELTLVQANTQRLQRLMNQLLDFHKQETGNVQLKVQEANIVEFVDEIQLSFKEYAQSRRVLLTFSSSETDLKIWFDREEMSKVICNLLINAFKFTPGGGAISVRVSREEGLTGEFRVRIVVEDNGLGIPSPHLDRLFHRFYQAENAATHEAGVGIGLALCKGIVELHHGSISVDSVEATENTSGFTRFVVGLPSGRAHFSDEQILTEPRPEEYVSHPDDDVRSDTKISGKQESNDENELVLVIEDNDEIRTLICNVLEGYYRVIEAANGADGWDLATHRLPDVVVSDVVMPRMDGLALTRKLKQDERTSHIPVILLTGRVALNYQLEGLATGADDYLAKPVDTRLLLAKVKSHLVMRDRLREKYSRIVTLQPKHEEIQNPDDRFLQRLLAIIEENIVRPEFNVMQLVREIGMSRPVLFRKTKMLTGLSVIDLIKNVRLKKAEMLLKQKKLSISEIAFTVGFNDPKYFSKAFRSHFGKSPTQYLDEIG